MKKHDLKIKEEYLENLLSGRKKVEIRYNDRDYQLGDELVFWDRSVYLKPKKVCFKIIHVHSGLGMAENYVALSVEPV